MPYRPTLNDKSYVENDSRVVVWEHRELKIFLTWKTMSNKKLVNTCEAFENKNFQYIQIHDSQIKDLMRSMTR